MCVFLTIDEDFEAARVVVSFEVHGVWDVSLARMGKSVYYYYIHIDLFFISISVVIYIWFNQMFE